MFRRKESSSLAQETYLKSCQTGRPSLVQRSFMDSHTRMASVDKENVRPGNPDENTIGKRFHNHKLPNFDVYNRKPANDPRRPSINRAKPQGENNTFNIVVQGKESSIFQL